MLLCPANQREWGLDLRTENVEYVATGPQSTPTMADWSVTPAEYSSGRSTFQHMIVQASIPE